MAIIKVSAPVAGIRGTVGGMIYSANKSGAYVRRWTGPINPRSGPQSIQRGNVGGMAAAWRALTSGQRADWDTYAGEPEQELTNPLGESYYASGWNWYVSCNTNLARVGRAPIEDAPTVAVPAAPTMLASGFRVCRSGSDSNVATGGTPSASSTRPAYVPIGVFDPFAKQVWVTESASYSGWLEYQFTAAKRIRAYEFYWQPSLWYYMPKDWTFEIYSGGSWLALDTVVNAPATSGTWNYRRIVNDLSSTRYRWNITETQNTTADVGQGQTKAYLGDYGQSCVIYEDGQFSGSPAYDLIVHIAMSTTTGRTVASGGFYEVCATSDPGYQSQAFQLGIEAAFGQIQPGKKWFARAYRQTVEGRRSSASVLETETAA